MLVYRYLKKKNVNPETDCEFIILETIPNPMRLWNKHFKEYLYGYEKNKIIEVKPICNIVYNPLYKTTYLQKYQSQKYQARKKHTQPPFYCTACKVTIKYYKEDHLTSSHHIRNTYELENKSTSPKQYCSYYFF
jgi:hypothetical protein